ncbi:superoxide dismutase, Ni [Candidatus Saccharibacteria bacterium]|jgi:nickel superoxide dismutase|nr:superoxide dismutase, Ni [Candidatus Saccharibacteria bacterium]MBP7834874.1 superoxide dismutase, Ni [Candidatus Saccharibacteria bacterium]
MKFIKDVYAHCDIPCGIYETDTAKHASATCLRMVEKIEALDELSSLEKNNNFVRMVIIKEESAQKVKDELYLLWSDYFKPEHLERFSNLHDLFWKAIKQASIVKQTVSKDECDKLTEMIEEIDKIFIASKE